MITLLLEGRGFRFLRSGIPARRRARSALLVAALLGPLVGCTEGVPETSSVDDDGGLTPTTPLEQPSTPASFTLRSVPADAELVLVEGDAEGLRVPLELERLDGHAAPVSYSLSGASAADVADISGGVVPLESAGDKDRAEAFLRLAVADRPILPGERRFIVTASDGERATQTELSVSVRPTAAPDVYLLIGQSNMVGASGAGARQDYPGGPDEPHPRVRQLNVTGNDGYELFTDAAAFAAVSTNVIDPAIVTAEEPLHVPRDGDGSEKRYDQIGLGLPFAKRALEDTTADIVLVPAAWSGSAFCANFNGPAGQWNAGPTDGQPELGNSWLFDRALTRVDAALAESGGILRGILWHQGESDANERCAPLYADNLERLVRALRTRIAPDARGEAARGPEAPIPFVVGTMSRGIDENGDYSDFAPAKQMIDDAHRAIASRVPHSAVSLHDDLVPANGYPCGQTDCIHFGPEALREMGRRYYDALVAARPPR